MRCQMSSSVQILLAQQGEVPTWKHRHTAERHHDIMRHLVRQRFKGFQRGGHLLHVCLQCLQRCFLVLYHLQRCLVLTLPQRGDLSGNFILLEPLD